MSKKKPYTSKINVFRRGRLVECPKCTKKKVPVRDQNTEVYCTRGSMHYMRCRRCGHNFKAQDLVAEAEIRERRAREALREAEIEAAGTSEVLKHKRVALARAEAEHATAQRNAIAAIANLKQLKQGDTKK